MILRIMEIEKVFAGPHDLTTGKTSAVPRLCAAEPLKPDPDCSFCCTVQ